MSVVMDSSSDQAASTAEVPQPSVEVPIASVSADESLVESTPIVQEIIKYNPRKGFYVHWKGCRKYQRTWQSADEIPVSMSEQKEAAMSAYRERVAQRKNSRSPKVSQEAPGSAEESENVHAVRKPTKRKLELLNSIVDEATGETRWVIDEILKYSEKRGYYVSWVGFSARHNSWQRTEDMPTGLTKRMKEVRQSSLASAAKRVDQVGAQRAVSDDAAVVQVETPTTREVKLKVIHSVLEYDPSKGFLVHWKGDSSMNDSWVPAECVNESYRYQVLLAQERYIDNTINNTGNIANGRPSVPIRTTHDRRR